MRVSSINFANRNITIDQTKNDDWGLAFITVGKNMAGIMRTSGPFTYFLENLLPPQIVKPKLLMQFRCSEGDVKSDILVVVILSDFIGLPPGTPNGVEIYPYVIFCLAANKEFDPSPTSLIPTELGLHKRQYNVFG